MLQSKLSEANKPLYTYDEVKFRKPSKPCEFADSKHRCAGVFK